MKIKKAVGISALLLVLNCSFSIAGEEKIIPLSDVPENLLSEAKKLLPTATFNTANTEKEDDGTLVYEIQGTLGDGRKVEVDVLENGDIQEFEVVYSLDLVPRAVIKAIEKKMPGFTPSFIEASHSASKKVVGYEFVGELGGKKLDIDVSADGRRIEIADQ
jgi:hypothetical protein